MRFIVHLDRDCLVLTRRAQSRRATAWQRTVTVYNRQGDYQLLRLFPDDGQVPIPEDDPNVVRIRVRSVGWTNPRRFGDVWLGLWLWKFLHLDEIRRSSRAQGKETIDRPTW